MYNIHDFGAEGIAIPAETLKLEVFVFKWVHYPEDLQHQVWRAKEDRELDSVGIQRAIDTAHAQGGGTVVVPPGNYLIGPVELRSNVRLHLESGARLWGSPCLDDYRGGNDGPRYLISATGAENSGISGRGQISGQSPAFLIPWMNTNPVELGSLARPSHLLQFMKCRDILLEDIRVFDSPSWSIVFQHCDGIRVDGIKLRSMDVINNDGIDLVNSSNVIISNCDLYCTDDAIVLKNHDEGTTMHNVTVTNCILRTWCNGFKIGTESLGNFRDITVSNLVMYGDEGRVGDRGGINICAVDGGSVMNVNVSNVVMRNMFSPFYFYATNRDRLRRRFGLTPDRKCGKMERISISNIQADGVRYTSFIVGHPDEPIRDISITNVNIRKTMDFCKNPPTTPVPEVPDEYPTPFTFGSRGEGDGLPASGLYLRHVNTIRISDFTQCNAEHDARDLLVQESCSQVLSRDLDLQNPPTQAV